ncbi:MAG: undecaprenyl-phosphate glucose phosphotransferase [Mediterranea sp.]|nr:undecaprenyl-phosphate glucose phosphotransferase [Mediterranea sp.]
MQDLRNYNRVFHFTVIMGDLTILNLLMCFFTASAGDRFWSPNVTCTLTQGMGLMSLCYLLPTLRDKVILDRRLITDSQIILHTLRRMGFFIAISLCTLLLFDFPLDQDRFIGLFYVTFILLIVIYRLGVRRVVTKYRNSKKHIKHVVLLGGNQNIQELYECIVGNPMSGYQVVGYFDDSLYAGYPPSLPYLGKPSEVVGYLQAHPKEIDDLFCNLPSVRSNEIMKVINYCENHLVRFYSVPNVRNYLKRRMHFEILENVPVLSIRNEPLTQPGNRFVKRLFDIVVSLLFLCTVFPFLYLIIGICIKLSSPGPIFFKQDRSGEDGKIFKCYKFRSMRVNQECDKLQATKEDPRKTPIGDFIRRTNIDELPQLINVLKGDMSIVGPRPHMLKHTEEYCKLINKFMVRHQVKPGITGWAQVTGYRGETQKLSQMEGRVRRDIWYLEHWSFLIDLYIIYLTIVNMLRGEKEAY